MEKRIKTIINFKTYKYGEDSIGLVKSIEEVDGDIIIGIQPSEIYKVSRETDFEVYAQHIDPIKPGRNTGYITPESVKSAGAEGTFLNHSEHSIDFETIKKSVERCNEVGLKTAIFASSIEEAKKIEKLNPDYLIYEPPELVGGDTSVSTSKPEMIEKMNQNVEMPFLVGAGIKTNEDVKTAMELGASGIAIASGICKADNPGEALKNLISTEEE